MVSTNSLSERAASDSMLPSDCQIRLYWQKVRCLGRYLPQWGLDLAIQAERCSLFYRLLGDDILNGKKDLCMSDMSLNPLYLSPSDYHRRLMAELQPARRYIGGDVTAWQRKLRRQLRSLLGYASGPKAPLNIRQIWRREHPLGVIEKVIFTSEPCADVPAYVCLPKNARPPYPFMICLQGHSTGMHVSIGVEREDETKAMDVPGDRDFALGCMARGIAALCIEQRSFGERREQAQTQVSSHGCHDAAMQALLIGKTLIGERVYDVERGMDYLATRGDADMRRVGVMGNSGGGTTSVYAAALLPRLAFAMPSCAFCTFRDSIGAIYHCADNYVPGILKVADMADVLGLFAPRPVVVVAGREDSIFPIDGVQLAFEQLRRIYAAAGAEDACHLVVGEGGHRFYAGDAWPVMLDAMQGGTH
jgi:dienelactone hydrolase